MKSTLQQGHADGLCGIYAILNFLRGDSDWAGKTPADELQSLLDACHHLGWLNPLHIAQGFADYQLKAILDHQIVNYRLSWVTHYIHDVTKSLNDISIFDVSELVTKRSGALICRHDGRNHWLLIKELKGAPTIFDSANVNGPTRLSRNQRSLSSDWGLVILPQERAYPKVII